MVQSNPDAHAQVIVVGAACIDIKGRTAASVVPGTSNPGEIRISVGGVGRNIAESLGRLGVDVVFFSAVGDDDWGRDILRRTKRGNVELCGLHIANGERSAAFLTALDERGESIVSIDNIEIMHHITGRYLSDRRSHFANAQIVVCDGNPPDSAFQTLFNMAERYKLRLVLDPTSVSLALKLKPYLSRFYLVTPDIAEAEALTGLKIQSEKDATLAAQALVSQGVEIAIVTMAEQGCCYATSETVGRIPAIRSEMVDRIGAGDALTAAVVFGLLNELPVDDAVRLGVAAAALTLRSKDAVYPNLSLQALYDAMVP